MELNGFSIVIVFGAWAKPGISVWSKGIRFCLGFVAIAFMASDLEVAISQLQAAETYLEAERYKKE